MQTTPGALVMFVVAAFLGALGQFLYKSDADRAGSSVASYLRTRVTRQLTEQWCAAGKPFPSGADGYGTKLTFPLGDSHSDNAGGRAEKRAGHVARWDRF